MKRSLLVLLAALAVAGGCYSSRLDSLQVLQDDYPQAFFFRGCEGWSARKDADWQQWDERYSRLMGIMGKSLDEEVLGREAKNPEWFTRFKQAHPEQAVLLHFNGNARDPRHGIEKYFAGHWIYRKAVNIMTDIPAEEGESVIAVDDVNQFKINAGRYRTSNDDIALFGVTSDGQHDWYDCEQVQLIDIDQKKGTITVKRGCYGTRPRSFKAGHARAAAHAVEGPWGKNNNIMWFYNFASHCPLDAEGRNCADRLVDDLGDWFGKGGKLEAFDGLEFDVLHHVTHGDTTGDGEEDDGVVDGVNAYGIGVYNFALQLRKRLGRDTIIQADGALGPGGERSQRVTGIFNGIESEGWPNLRDWDFEDWSGGINRHNFWHLNAFKPAFSYINHKWIEPVPGQPGAQKHPQVPFSRHRLALAGAQFTDAVVTFAFSPPQNKKRGTGIWDELVCGAENRRGWLGKPLGKTMCLAQNTPDLLADVALAERISGKVAVKKTSRGLLIESTDPACENLTFKLHDLALGGCELTVFAEMSAMPRGGYPKQMPRFATLTCQRGYIDFMDGDVPAELSGECVRGASEQPIDTAGGAMVRFRPTLIGTESKKSFAIHPPYKTGKGYVFWMRDVELPTVASDLRFALGMGEKAPSKSDGVWFSVAVAEVRSDGSAGEFIRVFEKNTKAHEWIPCSVALQPWAGKRVRLKFIADCGPRNNCTTDQGYWADVRLVKSGVKSEELTPAQSAMTWLNPQPFEASFYYRGIRSKEIDLIFTVEGNAPVLLHSLSAHVAADARCRIFENGVVLGNPGHQPFIFDLQKIAPGMKLRRLKATELQDSQVNNGEPVVETQLTVAPLDALFLERE